MEAGAAAVRKRARVNGEGGVYRYSNRRKDGSVAERWRGTATVGFTNGKQLRRTVTGTTKGDVLRKLREVQGAVDRGLPVGRSNVSVGAFLDEWLTSVLPGTVRGATLQQYGDIVRLYIKPIVGHVRLTSLTPRDVSAMQQHLATKYEGRQRNAKTGVAPHTQRNARSVLRRALRWAQQEGHVARNVAAIADGIKINDEAGRTLTPDQARSLLHAVEGDRLVAAVTVALALGLRLGELLGLSWADVELHGARPRLTVRRALKRVPERGLVLEDTKTRTSRRSVYLPPTAAKSLAAHRAVQQHEQSQAGDRWIALPLGADLVFRTPLGTAIDPANFRHFIYGATQRAGLGRWSPHELRHSAASLLLSQGVPLKVVSETLGHSSIRITADVYGHLLEPARQEAADAMQRALFE